MIGVASDVFEGLAEGLGELSDFFIGEDLGLAEELLFWGLGRFWDNSCWERGVLLGRDGFACDSMPVVFLFSAALILFLVPR